MAEPRGLPRGLAAFLIALVGLGISIYLTIEHYDAKLTLACPESKTINCAKVTTSKWSHLGPIPVALLGLIFFVAMAALCSPPAWRAEALDRVRVVGAAVGTVSVVYLVYIELFRVDAICLWCTGVHVCTLALLAAVLWQTTPANPEAG
ncbi:vitamin K epoxide reductase family protein [Jatrophihabitans sp.]|uniref:vitamin K epoxide reductase family protein n=1 Tax=Jatrophihabitans sp. TaxID=1932789 RepID=UPI0030C665A6|nr:Vitamin epoxide reductase [Jatrophihabitans sp.]